MMLFLLHYEPEFWDTMRLVQWQDIASVNGVWYNVAKGVSCLMDTITRHESSDLTENQRVKHISFPQDEISGLRGKRRIITTRVSDDFARYHAGDAVVAPWGDMYNVAARVDIKRVNDHPYADFLTDEQRRLIGRFKRIAVLTLALRKRYNGARQH